MGMHIVVIGIWDDFLSFVILIKKNEPLNDSEVNNFYHVRLEHFIMW